MTNRKTVRVLASVAVAAVALVASAGTAASAQSVSAKPAKGSVHLGIAYWDTRTYAFQLMYKGAQAVAAADPAVDLKGAAPDSGDPTKLLPLFQSLAGTQTNGVILQTLAADPFLRPVQSVTAAGTPVIAIDAPPPAGAGVTLFITNNNEKLGESLAAELFKKIPANATGEVVIGTTGAGIPPLEARILGMQTWLKANRPNVTVDAPQSTAGSTGSAAEVYGAWQSLVQQHPKALAYMAPSAQDAVALGLLNQKLKLHLNAGGMDLEPAVLPYIKQGLVNAVVSPEHWLKGYIAAKLLAAHAEKGTPIPTGTWDTGGLVVNSKNIDSIIARQKNDKTVAAAMSKTGDYQIAHSSKYITK
jgi:ABC-type sugar transport system substrate-binding protein